VRRRGFLLLALVGCGSRTPDPEALGDLAWAEGRTADALLQWRRAGRDPRVLAKRAEASLRERDLLDAVGAYLELARDEPRRGEAAAGLARVAALASRLGDNEIRRAAVLALREAAPSWPVGRLALGLDLPEDAPDDEVARLAPVLLALGMVPAERDSLLLRLARVDARGGRCPEAVPILEGLARRGVGVAFTLAGCELVLGEEAERIGDLDAAEGWWARATEHDPLGVSGRLALLRQGDIRLRRGDLAGADIAWQTVAAAPVAADSITVRALERLGMTRADSGSDSLLERP
jgi:tetratricopeptide (TPR) repeat protein